MEKPRIIIADEDLGYILHLELHFIEEMFDRIDLEVITDRGYFRQLFQNPQTASVLIVSEALFTDELLKHEIASVFVLSESFDFPEHADNVAYIYKYTNVNDIFSVVRAKTKGLTSDPEAAAVKPQVILVTSASGGTGKTTVAMGIAGTLSGHMKKALYINVDYLQAFQSMLTDRSPINDSGIYMDLASGEKDLFSKLNYVIRQEQFYYLPPLKAPLISLGISRAVFKEIIKQAVNSGQYEYIVVDTDSVFDQDKVDLLGIADKTILVTTQTEDAVFALRALLSGIDVRDRERTIVVCNQFDRSEKNALLGEGTGQHITVAEYIEKSDAYEAMKKKKFTSDAGIRKIAMMVI